MTIQFEEGAVLPGIVLPRIKNDLRTGDSNLGIVGQKPSYDLGDQWWGI